MRGTVSLGCKVLRLRILPCLVVAFLMLMASVQADASAPTGARRVPLTTIGLTAGTVAIAETGHLQLSSRRGNQVINEQGQAAGTPGGSLSISLTVAFTQARITFTSDLKGGSISGQGRASYYTVGSTSHFEGTLSITHGTGRYAHASASNVKIKGTLRRSHNYALEVLVDGSMHY